MKLLIALIVIQLFTPLAAKELVSPITAELRKAFTQKDHDIFKARGIVLKKRRINKSPWPELTLYFLVDASALESFAIFSAHEHQKNYIPNLIQSKIVKQISPLEVHTQYELELPWPLTNSKYIHGSLIKKIDHGAFRIEWYLVSSDSADEVKGFAEFYPREEKTIVKYRSFIRPKNFLAGLFKNSMISDVKKSLEASRAEIKKLKNGPLSKEIISTIKQSFDGKYAYPKNQQAQ